MSSLDKTFASNYSRSPLLWLVLPALPGVYFAVWTEVSPIWAMLPGLMAVALLWLGERLSAWVWWLALSLATFCVGWIYTDIRLDRKYREGTEIPPREVQWTVRLLKTEIALDQFERRVGTAKVLSACEHLPQWAGRTVRLAVHEQRMAGTDWLPGTTLKVQGVWQGFPAAGQRNPWQDRQKRLGISGSLSHVQIISTEKSAAPWREQVLKTHEYILATLLGPTPELREARILAAMVLGRRSLLAGEDREKFLLSGTMHLFAISGLHVGIVASLAYLALSLLRLKGWLHYVLGIALVGYYVQVTGAPASAVRAWIMVSLFWLAKVVFRQNTPLATLSFAAVVVLLWQPLQVMELGFQLSYLVVAALLLYAVPLIQTWQNQLPLEGVRAHVRDGFCVSLAAFMVSSPLVLDAFGVYSPGGILLNIVLVFMALLAVTAAALSVLVSLLPMTPIEHLFQRSGCMSIHIMVQTIEWALHAPGMYLRREDGIGVSGLPASICILSAMAWGRELQRQGVGWLSWLPAPLAHGLWLVMVYAL